ncbi:MAG: putative selenoprotein [Deltaproteobacteria bacterium]|nr:putative selenoprotein [Deltaproteobacteria bacterium]
MRRVIRQVIGAPDYDTYLDHCRTAGHPPRLTQPEYVREFFERKGRAPRCC